jgi:predicted Zn finger-like uncharacterized protein
MLVARCPNCNAKFRVLPETLNQRQGKVRCGECQNIFNAFQTLSREPDPPPRVTPLPMANTTRSMPTLPVSEPTRTSFSSPTIAASDPPKAAASEVDKPVSGAAVVTPVAQISPVAPSTAAPVSAQSSPIAPLSGSAAGADASAGKTITVKLATLADPASEPARAPVSLSVPLETPVSLAPRSDVTPTQTLATPVVRHQPLREPVQTAKLPEFATLEELSKSGKYRAFRQDSASPASPASPAPPAPDPVPPVPVITPAPAPSLAMASTPSARATSGDSPVPKASVEPTAALERTQPLKVTEATVDGAPSAAAAISRTREAADTFAATPPAGDSALTLTERGTAGAWVEETVGDVETATRLASDADKLLLDRSDEDALARREATLALGSPHASRSGLWSLGAFLLVLLAVAQAAYVWRAELAVRWPEARPWLEMACEPLACAVPWQNDPKAVDLVVNEFREDPREKGRYLLSATLNHRSNRPQELPLISVKLTNNSNQAVVLRHLRPAEYLGRPLATGEVLAPGATLQLQLKLETSRVQATGYEIGVAYPGAVDKR